MEVFFERSYVLAIVIVITLIVLFYVKRRYPYPFQIIHEFWSEHKEVYAVFRIVLFVLFTLALGGYYMFFHASDHKSDASISVSVETQPNKQIITVKTPHSLSTPAIAATDASSHSGQVITPVAQPKQLAQPQSTPLSSATSTPVVPETETTFTPACPDSLAAHKGSFTLALAKACYQEAGCVATQTLCKALGGTPALGNACAAARDLPLKSFERTSLAAYAEQQGTCSVDMFYWLAGTRKQDIQNIIFEYCRTGKVITASPEQTASLTAALGTPVTCPTSQ